MHELVIGSHSVSDMQTPPAIIQQTLTLGLVLPAILVPCMLTVFLAFITVFGMMYFKKETARLGRAFAPNVGPDSTLLITDIQVRGADGVVCLHWKGEINCCGAVLQVLRVMETQEWCRARKRCAE
jgi:hypothetical protein